MPRIVFFFDKPMPRIVNFTALNKIVWNTPYKKKLNTKYYELK